MHVKIDGYDDISKVFHILEYLMSFNDISVYGVVLSEDPMRVAEEFKLYNTDDTVQYDPHYYLSEYINFTNGQTKSILFANPNSETFNKFLGRLKTTMLDHESLVIMEIKDERTDL